MRLQVLRSASYRRMPWKNGGGETLEIAVSPQGAPLDAIDWRISMAIVASDGPFSLFPGIDRTLSILEGEIELQVQAARFTLSRASAPLWFPADVPAAARLPGGVVTDLNVMTHRARYRHEVRRIAADTTETLDTQAEVSVIFCVEGLATCGTAQDGPVTLEARDCALLRAPGRIAITTRPGATVLLAGIYGANATPASSTPV